MSSIYDRVRKLQLQEALRQDPVPLGWYRHFRGGAYVAYSAEIDEATGDTRVSYFSALLHARWSRLRHVVFEMVPPETSGGDVTNTTNLVPRFVWWRPATREELSAAAFGGPNEIHRVFGDALDHGPHATD